LIFSLFINNLHFCAVCHYQLQYEASHRQYTSC